MEQIDCRLDGEALRNEMLKVARVIVANVDVMFNNRKALLASKLEQLKQEEQKVQEERAHGDTSENVAYTIAIAAVSALKLEISTLEHSIQRYSDFLDLSKAQEGAVGSVASIGSTVCIADVSYGSQNPPTWVIRLYPEGIGNARNGGIAVDTPLGAALCGHRAGEYVSFKAPRGDMRYFIKEVL